MKKIGLFLGVSPRMGGAYQYSLALAKALAALPADEYQKIIVYTDHDLDKYLRHLDAGKIFVRFPRLTFALGVILTLSGFPIPLWHKLAPHLDPLARILLKQNADLWVFSSYSFVCSQMPVRAVGIIHDLMHRYEPQFREVNSLLTYFWRELAFKRMCRSVRGIFADSHLGRRQVLESYPADPDKIQVLPYTVPDYIFTPEVPADFMVRYQLPAKYFFYPAQFWEHKNHENLILAMAQIKEQIPDLKLVLAGTEKNSFQRLMKLAEAQGVKKALVALGFVPDAYLPELYRRARALIMPTFFGPTNIPPLEAFACGCPVAVSGVYAMPEQLGDAALYFRPEAVEEIAAVMLKLWLDDRLCAQLAEKGRTRFAFLDQHSFNLRFRENIDKIIST